MTQSNGIRQGQEMENLGKKDKREKNGYISEIVHVCACILGLGSGSKKGRQHKNSTALSLSFTIFKLNFHVDDLPDYSTTLCTSSGTEYSIESQGTCSQIFISLALCDEGRVREVVHK